MIIISQVSESNNFLSPLDKEILKLHANLNIQK